MERFFVRIAGQTVVSRQRAALHPEEAIRPYSLEELPKLPCSEWERSAVLDWAESAPVGSWLSWLNRQATEEVHGAVWFCLRRREPDDRPPVPDEVELLAAADRLEELGMSGAAAALRKLVSPPQQFYLLQINNEVFGPVSLWDRCVRAVVLATSEQHARQILHDATENETAELWLDPERSSCVALSADSKPGVVLRDILAS